MTRQSTGPSRAISSPTARPAVGKIPFLFGLFILAACSGGQRDVPLAFSTGVAADGPTHTEVRGILAPRVPESERTRVMVLGTDHLGVIQERFNPALLDGVIGALQAFDPDLITIETQRPTDLAEIEATGGAENEAIIAFFARTFINAGHGVRERMGVTWLEAFERQEALLAVAEAGETLPPADRLELAAYSLAAYDYFTALLQWSYLEPDQREAGQWIPDEVASGLTGSLESANEFVSVAIRLARSLGLQRLYPVDDQRSNRIQSREELEELMATVEATGLMEPLRERSGDLSDARDAAIEAGDLLPFFLHLNSTAYQEADLGGQWAMFLEEGVDPLLGRARVARREVRDLQIATHVRWVTARHPGKTVLVLIGASHKPFLESYLSQIYDIELVQLSEFVRASEPGS